MRKAMLFAAIAMVWIAACTKQKTESPAVDVQKVEEVVAFSGDPGSRVIAFNILTPAEKAYAFKKHIRDNYLKVAITDEQKRLAEEAIEMIVPEMYMADKKEQFTGVVAAFGYRATQLFAELDYVRLFQNLADFETGNTISAKIIDPVEPPVVAGDCYCEWNSTCTAYADTKGPKCITNSTTCNPTKDGCGWLWLSKCTGDCGK